MSDIPPRGPNLPGLGSDLFADEPVPLLEQIICVEREIRMRERAYPRFVASGRMKQHMAEREITVMRAVLETLRGIGSDTPLQERKSNEPGRRAQEACSHRSAG